jgi:microcystin-dependent protein
MPRNASGVYTLPNPDVVSGNTIEALDENQTRDDMATELTSSLDRSGRGAMLAPFRLFDGSVSTPGLGFSLDTNTGMFRIGVDNAALVAAGDKAVEWSATQVLLYSAGVVGVGYLGATNGFQLSSSIPLGWSSGTVPGTNDLSLYRDAADILAQRRGVNPQDFRLYNTFTDASNYERGNFEWDSSSLRLTSQAAGTGVLRNMLIGGAGGDISIFFRPNVGVADGWILNAASHLLADVDNTNDIGASGASRPRTLYVGTSLVLQGHALTAAAPGVIATDIPAGVMFDYGGTSVPTGYLACDGTVVSRTTYAALFTAIGTTWNTGGEPGTDFRLPNLNRRATVGSGGSGTGTLGNAVGNIGGAETHTIGTTNLPASGLSIPSLSVSVSTAVTRIESGAGAVADGITYGSSDGVDTRAVAGNLPGFPGTGSTGTGTTGNMGSGSAMNIMQPSAVVRKIIKT